MTLIGLAINDRPIIAIQLPTEISSQLDNDTLKQQDFLTLLTGTAVIQEQPLKIFTVQLTASASYSSTYHSVYLTFPSSTLVLLPEPNGLPPFRLMWAHFINEEFQSLLLLTAKTIRFEEPYRCRH